MPVFDLPLAYLFECHFKDGTILKQQPDGTSDVDPTCAAFTTVLNRMDEVLFFGLYNDKHTFVVSLVDGHFEIDNVVFRAQNPDPEWAPPPGAPYRLIYFLRNAISRTFSTADGSQIGADIHEREYHIGWQYTRDVVTANGTEAKTFKQTICVR